MNYYENLQTQLLPQEILKKLTTEIRNSAHHYMNEYVNVLWNKRELKKLYLRCYRNYDTAFKKMTDWKYDDIKKIEILLKAIEKVNKILYD